MNPQLRPKLENELPAPQAITTSPTVPSISKDISGDIDTFIENLEETEDNIAFFDTCLDAIAEGVNIFTSAEIVELIQHRISFILDHQDPSQKTDIEYFLYEAFQTEVSDQIPAHILDAITIHTAPSLDQEHRISYFTAYSGSLIQAQGYTHPVLLSGHTYAAPDYKYPIPTYNHLLLKNISPKEVQSMKSESIEAMRPSYLKGLILGFIAENEGKRRME